MTLRFSNKIYLSLDIFYKIIHEQKTQ